MKFVLASFFIMSTAVSADLGGRWMNTTDGSLIRFIKVQNSFRHHSTQKFTHPGGRIAYTIDQHVKFPLTSGSLLQGTVDFLDSRGCTFRELPVVAEFQSADTLNVLMTVPRYKFQTITTRENGRPRISHACRVVEYIEVPVELIRY